ncbi:unnamed protein product [Chrysoparadoxa australica]
MKLQVKACPTAHQELVAGVVWTPENELYSFADDRTVRKWNMTGEPTGKVCDLQSYATCVSWFPSSGKQTSDMFAIASSDGTVRFMSRTGREEKKFTAHEGAVVKAKWSHDGSALVTCGEDGSCKIWSRSGNLRSTLMQTGMSLYAISWSPDNEQLLVGVGKDVAIKGIQAGKSQMQWTAHSGVVLALDWNIVNDLIVSGGEDCTYRVWDSFGRQLFQSNPYTYVITSVSWCPNGECFAVGAFNLLRLCDKTGWTHARERLDSGSIMDIDWTSDGTQLAAGGGNGSVLLGQLIERSLEWENYEAILTDSKTIRVQDVGSETCEELDFPRDRVVEMSLGYGHLVVATATQCFIYSTSNWNTPHIFDVRGTVSLIVQSARHFITLDNTQGIQVWSYEGHHISSPRFANLRSEFLNKRSISLSQDCVAILDRTDGKTIRLCDVTSGKALPEGNVELVDLGCLYHEREVMEIALSQAGQGMSERTLVFIDRNRDLWIHPIVPQVGAVARAGKYKQKLFTQVDSAAWSDSSDTLAAIADGRLVTWLNPSAAFVDRDLLELAKTGKDAGEYGKLPQIRSFFSGRIAIRRADGALLSTSVSHYPGMLHEFVTAGRWTEAIQLCRFVKNKPLWACLASMAIHGANLEVAEESLASLKLVDKLEYILHIKKIPLLEARNAELALYRKCPDVAESILLQASPPLVYRAIKLNIRLFRWSRALDVAVKHRQVHVDTVLGYRQKHLERLSQTETDERFLQYADQVAVDWEAINAKKEKEKEDERYRKGGGGGNYK